MASITPTTLKNHESTCVVLLTVGARLGLKCFASKVTFQAFVVLGLIILSQISVAEGADEAGVSVSFVAPIENHNTTQNITAVDDGPVPKSNTGAVVAACIIALIACVSVVVAVYFYKRRRQSRMMDREKKMQIQMSSAHNAGVYQDLTVSVPADDKLSGSPEHERLKLAEDA